MLSWLKQRPSHQLLGLIGCTILIYFMGLFVEFQPLLNGNVENVGRGILAGFLIAGIIGAFHFLLLLAIPRHHAAALATDRKSNLSLPPTALLGRLIFTACGEEVLLRGYVLGAMSYTHPALALPINALLSGLLNYRGKRTLSWTLVRTLEGIFFAALFLHHRSLVLVAVSHATSEAVLLLAARWRTWDSFLQKSDFHPRDFYGLFTSTSSRISQRI